MILTIEKFKDYQNQWIAFDEKTERILAHGNNISTVRKEAEEKLGADAKIVLKFIYPFDTYFSP